MSNLMPAAVGEGAAVENPPGLHATADGRCRRSQHRWHVVSLAAVADRSIAFSNGSGQEVRHLVSSAFSFGLYMC